MKEKIIKYAVESDDSLEAAEEESEGDSRGEDKGENERTITDRVYKDHALLVHMGKVMTKLFDWTLLGYYTVHVSLLKLFEQFQRIP